MGKRGKARAIGAHVHRYVNERRENHSRVRLQGHEQLISNAESHSRTMAKTGHFAHDAGGTTPQQRCSGFHGVSENISKPHDSGRSPPSIAGEAVKSWMNSRGHRENILRRESRIDGVGVWIEGNEVYITHNFAESRDIRNVEVDLPKLRKEGLSWAKRTADRALVLPYLPLRAVKRDWWRTLPQYRQKNLTMGMLIGLIIGWTVSPTIIAGIPHVLINGGKNAMIYRGVAGAFVISWLYQKRRG